MSRLKVCHFSSVHPTNDTRVFYRECCSLAKYYDVTLIAIGNQSEVKQQVNIIAVPKPKNRLIRLFSTTFSVYRLAKNQQADVYHFHDPELIPFGWLLAIKGKKVIYDIHENVTESMKSKDWLPLKNLFILLYLWFEKFTLSKFNVVLAEAWYSKVYASRYPKMKTILVRNFASADFLKPYVNTKRQFKQDVAKLFYMGSIDDEYCYKQLLEAFYIVNKTLPAQLKLIGWVSPTAKQEIALLPFWHLIKDKVYMPGYLDVTQGYQESIDCNLGLSFVGSNLNVSQSFPRKMYEYMQVGLPVVSSGYPNYRDLVEYYQTGLCVNNNSVFEIAETILQLLKSQEHLNFLAENNLKAAQHNFNWEFEFEQLHHLYKSLTT